MSKIMAKLDSIEKMILIGSKEVLNIEECALFTGLAKSTLYDMTSKRQIPHYKPRDGRLYFKKSEIESWLLKNKKASNKEIDEKAEAYVRRKKPFNNNNQ